MNNKKSILLIIVSIIIILLLGCVCKNRIESMKNINNNQNRIVLYYTTWCPHSVAFKPIWEKFAKMNNYDVHILAIDCEQKRSNCSKEPNVKGFPTVILYKKNGEQVLFNGNRTVAGLINFLKLNL